MIRLSAFLCLLISCGACGGTTSASSTAADTNDREEGKAKFESGMQAMEEGDLDEACQKFEEALEADRSFGPAIALGNCFEKQEKFASALNMYHQAMSMLAEDDERRPMVLQLASGIQDEVAVLTVLFPENAPDKTYVEFDDEDMRADQFGIPIALSPGTYRFEVKSPQHDDRDYDIELLAGEKRTLQLELGEID